jgi:DNA transformation protein
MSRYLDFVIEQLGTIGEITSRRMFGGRCLYCDGVVFALMDGDTLYLKADAENRPAFEEAGLPAFRPFADKPGYVMQYYLAPAEMFEDSGEVRRWAGGAVQAGRRAQQKKKPKKKRTPARRRA